MPDRLPHMLRADAQDNRDRILEVARALFAEKGIGITMREVARRAEIGPATLYRRFPAKQALIDAAFDDEMRSCRQIVEDGCADPDPWRGFCSVIERITVLNGRNQGFVDAFMSAHPEADGFAAHRAALLSMLADLAGRAKKAGRLRRDFVIDDLVLVLLTGRGLAAVPPARRETSARRFAALVVDAFRETDTNADSPPTSRQLSAPPAG
ncbi:TetR/AcrR family transcriptional regulator [Nocardia fusca]|uniref:TetR/AcrR family transcriptional regulator n=1 Tax=Nocardia fusca TaxID=941183 RepID=UPI0007A74A47|nr:TetR/AcrR family transcriptional regulator [Nocardia fusca]